MNTVREKITVIISKQSKVTDLIVSNLFLKGFGDIAMLRYFRPCHSEITVIHTTTRGGFSRKQKHTVIFSFR